MLRKSYLWVGLLLVAAWLAFAQDGGDQEVAATDVAVESTDPGATGDESVGGSTAPDSPTTSTSDSPATLKSATARPVATPAVWAGPSATTPFAWLGTPFINNSGTLVFRAERPNGAGVGIWTHSTSAGLQPVVEAGASHLFWNVSLYPAINDLGDVAFRACEFDPVTYAGRGGIAVSIGGSVVPIAWDGMSAPGTNGQFSELCAIYGTEPRRVLLNRNRMVLFDGSFIEPTGTGKALWSWTPTAGLRMVLRTGVVPPSALNGWPLTSIGTYDLNQQDEVAVEGGVSDLTEPYTESYHAAWAGTVGSLAIRDHIFLVLYVEGPYLGGPFLVANTLFGFHRIDLHEVSPGDIRGRNVQALSTPEAVALGGEPAPGTDNLEFASGDCPLGTPFPDAYQEVPTGPVLNDARETLIVHPLYDRDGNSTSTARDGIWRRSAAGVLSAVVIDRQPVSAWTGRADEVVDVCTNGTTNLAIASDGRFGFSVITSRPVASWPYPLSGTTLFARSSFGGATQRIVSERDVIYFPPTRQQVSVDLLTWGSGEVRRRDNPRSGHGILNDRGTFAYLLNLSDPVYGTIQAIYRSDIR